MMLTLEGNDPLVLMLILAFIVESRLTQSQSPFANGALVLGNAWALGCFPIGEISLLKVPMLYQVTAFWLFKLIRYV